MINLKLIKFNFLIFLFLILLVLFTNNSPAKVNKIIFKINNIAFTSLDYDMRVEYLNFVGTNRAITKKEIIKDYISASLFFEYYKNLNNKKSFEKEINEIFENINKNNDDLFDKEINKDNILYNIKIDYIRKIILQDTLNSNFNTFNTDLKEIDLLYKFKLRYINLNKNYFLEIKSKFNLQKNINFNDIKQYLENKNIPYFLKEKEINNIEEMNNKIKEIILSNKRFIVLEKNNNFSLIFVEKSFETHNGIVVDLYSIRSKEEIQSKDLRCNKLQKNQDEGNIISKKYKFKDLNEELKNKIINIDDYVKFSNNNEYVYVILCNINFDRDILNNVNRNKLINSNVTIIEKNFIRKYSDLFKLVVIDE